MDDRAVTEEKDVFASLSLCKLILQPLELLLLSSAVRASDAATVETDEGALLVYEGKSVVADEIQILGKIFRGEFRNVVVSRSDIDRYVLVDFSHSFLIDRLLLFIRPVMSQVSREDDTVRVNAVYCIHRILEQ